MAPQLGVSSRAIMNKLQGMGGAVPSPGSNIIDQMLSGYATGAAIPNPVLDGNPNPLDQYLNPTPSPVPTTNTTAPPMGGGPPTNNRNGFTPVGIPDDNAWHNMGGNVMEHQLNANHHPADVAQWWSQNNGEHMRNAQPYGGNGEFTVHENYPNLEAYKKDAARLSQLPPQAYNGNGGGQISGDLGGGGGSPTGNISQGTFAPPTMPVSATGSYGDTSGMLNQFARSAPQAPNPQVGGDAIRNKLAALTRGR